VAGAARGMVKCRERVSGRRIDGEEARHLRGGDGRFLGISGKPDYVRSAGQASLRRLGVDVIDLYYQHRVAAGDRYPEAAIAASMRRAGVIARTPASVRACFRSMPC
jgi:aryl-alcohol dehydrogenase-like predicted oxidoreductase